MGSLAGETQDACYDVVEWHGCWDLVIGCLPRQRLDVLAEGCARARGMLMPGRWNARAREVQGAVA